jgi:hypothetical protein
MAGSVSMPECEKLATVQDQSQAIGEFLEWLQQEKHYEIMETRKFVETFEHMMKPGTYTAEVERTVPIRASTEHLLAEFFGIDLNKVDLEKRALLKSLQE